MRYLFRTSIIGSTTRCSSSRDGATAAPLIGSEPAAVANLHSIAGFERSQHRVQLSEAFPDLGSVHRVTNACAVPPLTAGDLPASALDARAHPRRCVEAGISSGVA